MNNQITDFFHKLFSTSDFPARWHCGNWTHFHGWLYILSDLSIWAAYFAIPVLLLRVIHKRKDIALNGVIILFLAFVFLCGLTHLMDALIFWWPAYRLSALLKFATAIVSVIAAYALNRIFPELLALRSVKELKREIEKRKKTEARLLESEFLLLEAGRIARVGGWEYDLSTKKRRLSKAVQAILEIPQGYDIEQRQLLSFYPAPYRSLLEQALKDAMQNGAKWDLETLAVTLAGQSLWVRHIGEPVFNQRGQVVKIRGTLTDIDQFKRHEIELSNALKVAREKTERLKKFSYILSHNIRNHTSNLSALVTMAEADKLDDDNRDLILKSRDVTRSLTTTLDDLAEIMESQEESYTKETVNFESAVAKAILLHSIHINPDQLNLSFQIPNVDFPSLFLDSVIRQLLSNSIRYKKPEQSLEISFRSYVADNGNIVLECQDNGLGMDLSSNGNRLFDLYATFHPSLSGRGVGLFLIKTQIESQGGKIFVTSYPGKGSLFTILFESKAIKVD